MVVCPQCYRPTFLKCIKGHTGPEAYRTDFKKCSPKYVAVRRRAGSGPRACGVAVSTQALTPAREPSPCSAGVTRITIDAMSSTLGVVCRCHSPAIC